MPEELYNTFATLGISLGLGLLIGLQRQWQDEPMAGVRTFALITLLGTVAALLAESFGGWIIAAALIGLVATVAVGSLLHARAAERYGSGITTEIAIIVMFLVGAMLVIQPWSVGVAVGGAVAVLLQSKKFLHELIDRLGEKDLRAIMQFVLISLVILPVLPNQTYGPLDVINPRQVWWMVVLIVGISLGAYVMFKALGERAGMVLGGLLGGAISSTATTVSFARRGHGQPAMVRTAGFVIILASTVMYGRVLVEIAVVAPRHFTELALPIITLAAISIIIIVIAWFMARRHPAEMEEPDNPTELKSALFFGFMYAIVLLAIAAAEQYVGRSGIYVVALLSGLTDMDAITLSSARLVSEARLDAPTAWRAIMLGALANLVFKLIIVSVLAGRALALRIAGFVAISIICGIALILFWPG